MCLVDCVVIQYLTILTILLKQVDLLRIIRLLARHYASCAMSLKVTRSFDAARILTMSAMATIADALVRVEVW